MSEVTISNSPVHSQAIITYPYGVADSGYSCGFHTGIDFAPYGSTPANPVLYSVVAGEVVYVNNTDDVALGVQAVILASDGTYWRYCHMVLNSLQVEVRRFSRHKYSNRNYAEIHGNATGIHLHLEHSTTFAWQCSTFLNPCDFLQIPNIDDTIINYVAVPPAVEKKAHFPWAIYSNKIRKRRRLF